jgi:perosamine synthetase
MTETERFRAALGSYLDTDPERIGLFWKGRVALYAILRALGIGTGDEVIVPAFTCVAVPNAIIYTGARPVYADIDPLTYTIDPESASQRITSNTKAILAQNTFGLAPDLDELERIATSSGGLHVIEDCAHGFGGEYRGRANGTIADASFFSCQWSKPLPAGIGGITVATDEHVARAIREEERRSVEPGARDAWLLKALLLAHDTLLTPTTHGFLQRTYRMLSRTGVVIGSSDAAELEDPTLPAGFSKGMSQVQARRGSDGVERIAAETDHRRRVAEQYSAMLGQLGVRPPAEPEYARHTFLRYPLLVRDRTTFLAGASRARLEMGDWFLSPIHPVVSDYAKWGYVWGENPVGEEISQHIVNLPTGARIGGRYLRRLRRFLDEHQEELLR